MKIVRDKRLHKKTGRRRGWRGREGGGTGGRPRTRRIIARVILPRCARFSPLPSLSLLHARTRACVRACVCMYTRVSICMRERPARKERESSGRDERDEGGRGGRGVEALEEEVRGHPHSRRGRRDAHQATPTRKSFSTKPSSSSPLLSRFFTFFFFSSCVLFVSFPPGSPPPSPFARAFFRLFLRSLSWCVHTKRADLLARISSLNRTVQLPAKFLACQQGYIFRYFAFASSIHTSIRERRKRRVLYLT